ncbi:MAG: GSCFA domain-containing protein, partial [Bacteroidales bacterium]|nr:GSCFA domain-containing protein [Bacteroidales bacterium]
MKLQTPVSFAPSRIPVTPNDRVLVIGSCFADQVGARMQHAGFDACLNPFGTLYNPLSVAAALSRLCDGRPFTGSECVEMGAGAGLVCSFSHHTSFARETEVEFLSHANDSLEEASAFWQDCNKVLVTLGTIFCWLH